MTAIATKPGRTPMDAARRRWLIVVALGLLISIGRAGVDPSRLVNTNGWSQVSSFLAAAVQPDLSSELVLLAARESLVTLAFALLGTTLAMVIGLVGGVASTERVWRSLDGTRSRRGRMGWLLARLSLIIPRSMHEVVFGLLLVNVLGLNPLVAVLAIGIPFGAVTAKVFAEILDEVPGDAERTLRAGGASPMAALLVGTVPSAAADLLSYGFYRFECGIRSAAVLGIVGAGGLGFQLALSFQSLRYEQVWTFLWALIIISGFADRLSSLIRRRRNRTAVAWRGSDRESTAAPADPVLRSAVALGAVAIPVAYWWLSIDLTTLWAPRARQLAGELVRDSIPPRVGAGGLAELLRDAGDTVALAVLSIVLAWGVASILAFPASRTHRHRTGIDRASRRLLTALTRFVLLVSRSVPPPVWALVVVFVLFPGLWPGAVALAIYNAGVLGRLQSEVIENLDRSPEDVLRSSGASSLGAILLATVPALGGRFVALGLYRWEVAIRETVVVGVVGAAGLGRRLDEQTSSFDYQGILATILALIVVTLAVDVASASMRRSVR